MHTMSHFENCEDDGGPMRPLSFYLHRLLKRIDPGASGAETEGREEGGLYEKSGGIVVSQRIYKGAAAIDRDRGLVFEPLECAVYVGRRLLGRYSRTGVRRVPAFDSGGVWLGDYRECREARHAICRRWKLSEYSVEILSSTHTR